MRGGRPHPKDWERKLRVMTKLYERGLNITGFSELLGVNRPHLNEVIWGVRRSPIMEERIATFFGMNRDQLFPKAKRPVQQSGEVAA